MSLFALLDILLLVLIALFIPIGFWRGAQREALVTLGILFGAALADWWAEPWGRDLADITRLRPAGGAFMVAVLFLIGSTFLLGYGAGAVVYVPRPGLASRLLGALIAGGNGALLLSFALNDIRIYLLGDANRAFLDDAVVAHFLSVGVGWLLLAAAAVFLPVVVVLALFGRGTVVADFGEPGPAFERGDTPGRRRYPPRVPANFSYEEEPVYKTEPARREAEETRPLRSGLGRGASGWLGGEYRSELSDEQAVIARGDATPDAQKTVQLPSIADDGTEAALREGKCPSCHADIRSAEMYCPRCGRVL